MIEAMLTPYFLFSAAILIAELVWLEVDLRRSIKQGLAGSDEA
jgi:hypothetical protein